jgi:hypothetical protein
MAMDQFVRVLFWRNRNVEIDNTISGTTNDVLIVEAGKHRFDLGQPVNYTPSFIDKNVTGTTPAKPMEITFTPVAAPATPAPTAASSAKKSKKK